MLAFRDLTLRVNGRILFSDASFTLHHGQKTGLTGANGCGKSSLFRLILGETQADAGSFSIPPNLAIAHVRQEIPSDSRAAIEFVLDGDEELRQLEAKLQDAELQHDGMALATLYEQYGLIGGYESRARAARLLAGLGFSHEASQRPVDDFSGGWRMRLGLARALMCRSDLLLLDEPTNHLDLDAVLWLQEWLASYQGTLLFVSHDRDFLDELSQQILHIEQEKITLYTGNYSDFEVTRAERLAQNQAALQKQEAIRQHLQSYVDRFRAKATKARQAQSRLKLLQRMEKIAEAHVDSPFHFSFATPEKLPRPMINLQDASVGYQDRAIVSDLGLSIMPGDRIGLMGRNGAGKSTLIKLLAGTIDTMAGMRTPAQELRIGYFAQYQLELLDPEASPLLHLQRQEPRATEKELRGYLGGFDFQGDRALEPVEGFSGGEKARLVLAIIIRQKPNLLLLDEPTNHLDLEMRQALIEALQDFTGALVIISHDSYMLRAVTDQLILVHDGAAEPFDGDLDDYRQWLKKVPEKASAPVRKREPSAAKTETAASAGSEAVRKDQKKLDAARRQQLRPLRQAVERCELESVQLGKKLEALQQQLADESLYGTDRKHDLMLLLQQKKQLEEQQATLETNWLEASAALEEAETAVSEESAA